MTLRASCPLFSCLIMVASAFAQARSEQLVSGIGEPLSSALLGAIHERAVADVGKRGSILIFPKLELRWHDPNSPEPLAQDMFINLTNDYPGTVPVELYFFSEGGIYIQNTVNLTANQPLYWSLATGLPAGLAPFTVLGAPVPDPEGSTDLVLRGGLVVFAVNNDDTQVNCNYLTGQAVLVNYAESCAWSYQPWALRCIAQNTTMAPCGTVAGLLNLDGVQYDALPDTLLLDFYSLGTELGADEAAATVIEGDLSLLAGVLDFRQEYPLWYPTDVNVLVYNENTVPIGSMSRCILGWNETRMSTWATPSYFQRSWLQTNRGTARIDGVASRVCSGSSWQPLLGVAMERLDFGAHQRTLGLTPVGVGQEVGVIAYDPMGPPPPDSPHEAASLTVDLPPAEPPERALPDPRVRLTREGSLVVFPKVELRWEYNSQSGEYDLTQDTFLLLSNDDPAPVYLQVCFIHGDPAIPPAPGVPGRPGWFSRVFPAHVAGHQPLFWSAASAGFVSAPFTVLDPQTPPGRPDSEGSTDVILRGSVMVWATDRAGREISWNRLSGQAMVVDYQDGLTWSYEGYTAQALDAGGLVQQGDLTGTPFTLNLNGTEFDYLPGQLLMDFFTVGSSAMSSPGHPLIADGDLTLMPMILDVRDQAAATVTRAGFTVWNEDEYMYSGTAWCVSGWGEHQLSDLGGAFLLPNLHTNRGRARIDGTSSPSICTGSIAAPLLGTHVQTLSEAPQTKIAAGAPLVPGASSEVGTFSYYPDCNGNGVADWRDIQGSFLHMSDPLTCSTPSGSVEYLLLNPPTATGVVSFLIQGTNAPLGTVTLSVNGAVLGVGGFGVGACSSQVAQIVVPWVPFNIAVGNGHANVQVTLQGAMPCGSAIITVMTQYAIDYSPDVNTNGLPDECDLRGDLNGDDRITPLDWPPFEPCVLGEGTPAADQCILADLDEDGDVDMWDYWLLQIRTEP